jgi:hypothetical protein
MRTMWHCLAVLALLWAGSAVPAQGDTFMVVVEEFRNGEAVEIPLPSQEGLMSAMFDLGHVTFETGEYHPEMDWDRLDFAEPLSLAREGLGRYLAAVRVFAEERPRTREGVFGADRNPVEGVEITVEASYLLFDARSSRLLGRGTLASSSSESERDLRYDEFLFAVGEKIARALVALRPGTDAP